MNTEEKVSNFIRTRNLLGEGARVVVGLSGGRDSVCLALVLGRLGYEVVAMHCNFHLRGDESMRDELFVEELCRRHGLQLHKRDFDTAGYAAAHKVSIEMAAREQRYGWFRELMQTLDAEAIAVGHHKDDNAETVLLNMARGTGIKGMCGMQPKSDDVVRPLLCLTRKEIVEYLEQAGERWVDDHTNSEDAYARNKVRLNIVPEMESINSAARENITTTIENLNEVQSVYRWAMNGMRNECCNTLENGETHISIESLLSLPSPVSLLHYVLSPLGFNRHQLGEILASISESGRIFEAGGRRLLIDRKLLIVEGDNYRDPDIRMEVLPASEVVIAKDSRRAFLDADKLHGELRMRTARDGDSFAPFGMGGRRKLLSDYMTDLKMNRLEKERQSLLLDGDEIVWVVGRRSSELYRVTDETKRVLVLSVS